MLYEIEEAQRKLGILWCAGNELTTGSIEEHALASYYERLAACPSDPPTTMLTLLETWYPATAFSAGAYILEVAKIEL
jgi:hypothetical protein